MSNERNLFTVVPAELLISSKMQLIENSIPRIPTGDIAVTRQVVAEISRFVIRRVLAATLEHEPNCRFPRICLTPVLLGGNLCMRPGKGLGNPGAIPSSAHDYWANGIAAFVFNEQFKDISRKIKHENFDINGFSLVIGRASHSPMLKKGSKGDELMVLRGIKIKDNPCKVLEVCRLSKGQLTKEELEQVDALFPHPGAVIRRVK